MPGIERPLLLGSPCVFQQRRNSIVADRMPHERPPGAGPAVTDTAVGQPSAKPPRFPALRRWSAAPERQAAMPHAKGSTRRATRLDVNARQLAGPGQPSNTSARASGAPRGLARLNGRPRYPLDTDALQRPSRVLHVTRSDASRFAFIARYLCATYGSL